jgi:uncharacterized protein (TIGR02300 family)
MPAKDLGNKFVCFKCATKFYDLKKPDPVCPKCGTDQRDSPALKAPSEPRRGRLAAAPKVVEPVEPAAAEAEGGEEEEDIEAIEEEPAEAEGEEDI